jgi:hypothetical protein
MSDSGCGCCQPGRRTTPQAVQNRPALSEVAYRSGTWAEFRETMLALLSDSKGALAALRTREDDDPTIALMDAWAVACDVLTFYNERLVQESFLRTAVDPVSLQELGKLIGYRLDAGVAAETRLAFTLERPPTVPAPSSDPGLAPPTTPTEVTLPVGLRVQSIPGPGEAPQTFETVEEVVGRPEWSSMPVARTVAHLPARNDRSAWLLGTSLNLNPGAALLISGRTPATTDFVNDHWDLRLLAEVTEDRDLAATRVEFEWPLGSWDPTGTPAGDPAAYVLRKRFDVFGHNAPVWPTLDVNYRRGYAASITSNQDAQGTIVTNPDWFGFSAATGTGGELVVDLDGGHPDVVTGSWVVVSQEDGEFYRELYEVVGRAELSRAQFGISGTVTRLTLRGELHEFGTPRQVTVFGASEPLVLTERPDETDVTGDWLVVDGDARTMRPGRTICISSPGEQGAAEMAVVLDAVSDGVSPAGVPRTRLTLQTALTRSFDRAGAVVLGNVVSATHGETVHDVLGSGDARRSFQRFALTQGPLTYVQAATAGGSASTLHVSVDGVEWPEVPSHFGAGPTDRTVTHAWSPDLNPATGLPFDLVTFGDGVHGARVTTGSHNVRATYRKGLGRAGNLAANRLAQPLDRPLGVKAATNPLPATGGTDPEPQESARRTMPISVQTLGRAVSLDDYADFSLAFAGVSRAEARVLALRSGRTIVVSVCGPDAGPVAPSTLAHLRQALLDLGDPLVQVDVVPAEITRFRLALTVGIDPAYDRDAVLAAVSVALHASFDPAAGELGAPVAASAVIATAGGVPGVVAVDLDRLYRIGAGGPLLNDRLFANVASVASDGTPTGTELLGLSENPFDWLGAMTWP